MSRKRKVNKKICVWKRERKKKRRRKEEWQERYEVDESSKR
jgi:hypothetical protein